MTHREALEKIVADAKEYAAARERFRAAEGLPECHISYREGVRDGKLQAARVAEAALEEQV